MDEGRQKALAVLPVVALLLGAAYYYYSSQRPPAAPVSASFKIFEDFPDGSQLQIYPALPPGVVSCGSCGGGGSSLTFTPSDSVSFSGDTITGGSCSGTVSFSSVGSASVASQSVSGTGAASTSPMSCPMTSVSVPFSDFSSVASGTYTLTATLDSQGSVTFTNGGSDSGVSFAASPVSGSVTLTISGGVVTGVTGSI